MTLDVLAHLLPLLAMGAGLTILVSAAAMVLAIVLGMVTAVLSQMPGKWIRRLVRGYVELFRNTPLLIQLFILYFGFPQIGISMSPLTCGILALAIYTGAYNVEIFRAGLEAVPIGQHEAAVATGLSRFQEAFYVIIPQALRISFPSLGNNLVSLVKNSSLVSTIGLADLMFQANEAAYTDFLSFPAYGLAVVLYVVIILLLTRVINRIDRTLTARQ
ncbi:MAG TPA: amino acid ABC transporter permease [Paralcaligenes sp.]|jgi:His/Glu/Gln/Arg/opine family amino acid ABC transporter permease subunit